MVTKFPARPTGKPRNIEEFAKRTMAKYPKLFAKLRQSELEDEQSYRDQDSERTTRDPSK